MPGRATKAGCTWRTKNTLCKMAMSHISDSIYNWFMSEPIFALAIIAHPDDEAFLLAGTCLKFAAEGKKVGIICATHGEKGADRLNRQLTEAEMAAIRTKELHTAC